MKYSFLIRSRVILCFVILFSLILLGKLFLLQVVHENAYREMADRQYVTPSSDIYERGTIYFENKDDSLVSAATQTSGFKIAIDPTKIVNGEGVFKELSFIVANIDHDGFIASATKANDTYEEVAHRLTQEQADAVSALKIPGVSIFKENWRFYPGNNLASHTIGFVGYQGNTLSGRYGLEREYDSVLARSADNPYINFFAEVFSNIHKTLFNNTTPEGDVVTTIDPQVQEFLESKLEQVQTQYQPDSLGGIIMNPTDGSIYAMSAKPDFDPNNFSSVKDISVFSNPLVEHVFEFGSVVKPLVMAGALNMGVVTPETTYDDKGEVTIENHKIYNFDKRGRGPGTTMQDVLSQSLNTGMVFVEKQMGRINLRNYLVTYDIGKKTGIDLPNETSGLISNILTSPREIEYANAAFGQGIALTPMELIRALGSLANNGQLVVPHVVKEIKYDDGTDKVMTYPTTPTMIPPATAQEITQMMVTVMDKGLKVGLPHFSVAVKTGTAQIADNATGGYYTNEYTHSFVGFFPASNPKFIVFLYAVNPKGVEYSATTWTQPFLDITNFLLNYYNVPPDR
ncbi:MAG: penicillin-binding protein 2 [Candidatus Pacebacteria bacterium]|nr:penicillin-binding protein 2 [Candidatus Paceibacterota bacterium]